jgi:hypothetical protein
MSAEQQADSRRRRHHGAVPAPDFVPLAEQEGSAESTGGAVGKDDLVQVEPATAPEEAAAESKYQKLFDAIPPEVLRRATEPLGSEELVCVCMDDRNPDDGVYSAGGLILLDPEVAVEQIHRLGIRALKSHPGCGAGVILAQRRGLPEDQGDAAAVEQSMRIASLAGARYAGASAVDPATPHGARATLIFVDIPARRSLLRSYLPQSFYISGDAYPNREMLLAEVLLSAQIALQARDESREGFSREMPFSVVFVGRDKDAVHEHAATFQARMQAVLPVEISERIRVSTVC